MKPQPPSFKFSLGPRGTGFHITFENGSTVSVQWGGGTYSSNHDRSAGDPENPITGADTVEVYAWDKDGKFLMEDPVGYQTPEDVLVIMQRAAFKLT